MCQYVISICLNFDATPRNVYIFQIVEEKARFNHNPTNFAVAKTLLMKEKDIASQKGDDTVSCTEVDLVNNAFRLLKDRLFAFMHCKCVCKRMRREVLATVWGF